MVLCLCSDEEPVMVVVHLSLEVVEVPPPSPEVVEVPPPPPQKWRVKVKVGKKHPARE